METEAANFELSDAKMKELTTIKSLLKPEVSSQIGLIKQHVENGFPVDFSVDGWNFLHSACFVGNSDLLEFLLQRAKEKGGNICKKMLNERFLQHFIEPDLGKNLYYLTPLQLTLTRHGNNHEYKHCKLLVDYGADVNVVDKNGCTPLHTACRTQTEFTVELCKLLIDNGADVNVVGKDSCTPLLTACRTQTEFTVELCKLLIDNGADVNVVGKDSCTPLLTACRTQTEFTVELCKLLIDNGADPNFVNKDGCTPLHTACRTQTEFTVELCKVLIDSGADVNIVGKQGCTPLDTACRTQTKFTVELCKLLIDNGADVNFVDIVGGTAVIAACWTQTEFTIGLCKLLIDYGADVNFVDIVGRTPLHAACETQTEFTVELCKLLIDSGTDVNFVGKYVGTSLDSACRTQTEFTVELCKLLIDNGADVNFVDKGGRTPLHNACRTQTEFTVELCKLLIDNGADVNIVGKYVGTSLDTACRTQTEFTVELCKLLIDNGADVNFVFNDGCTPLNSICKCLSKFTKEICKLLSDNGADVACADNEGLTPLHSACIYPNEFTVDTCNLLIHNGAYVNSADNKGLTPLHKACIYLNEFTLDTCNLLIHNGADVNSCDEDGNTPLHSIILNHSQAEISYYMLVSLRKRSEFILDIYKCLIDHGADVNFQNEDGDTPLHSVFLNSHHFVSKLIRNLSQLLLDYGANLNAKNNNYETPIVCFINTQNMSSLVKFEDFLETINEVTGMLEFLIKAGADLMTRTAKHSQTLYHCIVECVINMYSNIFGSKEINREIESQILPIITKLLALLTKSDKGTISINSRDEGGNTPLHFACKVAQEHCNKFFQSVFNKKSKCLLTLLVDSLASCGSKVNATNDKQQTPLHFACTSHAIKTLLQLGATPNLKDDNGNTPMLEWTLLLNNDYSLALFCFSVEDLTEYLEQGVDPFLANNNGDTVLQVLLSKEKFVCAQSLIKAVVGVDRNNVMKKDANGDTFLHVVCRCDDDRVQTLIELLLQSAADPNVQNQLTKETPLHVLCRRISQSYVQVHKETKVIIIDKASEDFMLTSSAWAVQHLRKYGANPEVLDGNGKSCLDIAIDKRHSELKQILTSPVEQIESLLLLPWEQKSAKHSSMLAQVARHQKSKQVGVFHYHSEPIGSGAFGHVHVGISECDGREIAVKRIDLLNLCRPEDEREIANLLHLRDCEQVIKYQTFHKDEHFLYIILELMDGSLDELICREEDHVDLCRDVMSGILFLHNNGVIHRDIKPGNILYKSQPDRVHLKLADFGLSKKLNLLASTVMHSKAFTRCWTPFEILGTGAHSKASDVFSAGLVLHYILAEKKHPFGPKDVRGMSEAEIQLETEVSIKKGQLNLSETISPEACHLLKKMLQNIKDDRPTAASCLNHPFFWSKKKKKDFLCVVGNQPEFQKPRHIASSSGLSSVETDLEAAFASELSSKPWDTQIPQIYMEVACLPRSRRYITSSAVDLVRFIRNTYAHCSESTRSSFFLEKLLDEYVYFDTFPTLVITVYDTVMKYAWNGRKEIRNALS